MPTKAQAAATTTPMLLGSIMQTSLIRLSSAKQRRSHLNDDDDDDDHSDGKSLASRFSRPPLQYQNAARVSAARTSTPACCRLFNISMSNLIFGGGTLVSCAKVVV